MYFFIVYSFKLFHLLIYYLFSYFLQYRLVLVPSKFGLELILLENDQTVICSSYGIFPKPEINLYVVERFVFFSNSNQ